MLPGILGSLQALEVVKLLLDCGEPLIGRLLTFDGLRGTFRELRVRKDEHCLVCGTASTLRVPRTDIAGGVNACAAPDADVAIAAVSAEELAAQMQDGQPVHLIDVREPGEYAMARIAGATLLPLGELPARLVELDASQDYIVTCHKGGRALRACALMREAGFKHVRILEGGIDAWAARIDPSMLRY